MRFASDNWAGVHPAIQAAMGGEGDQYGAAYGNSETDKAIQAKFAELFEREVEVFLVGSGTAANSLGVATFAKPGGVVLAHSDSHIEIDECGAIGLQAIGTRTRLIESAPGGEVGKLDVQAVRKSLDEFPQRHVHAGQLTGLCLTQQTEAGTIYTPSEIGGLAELAKDHGLKVHMDGARLANAVARADVSPAEMTWKAGIDILSFGGTKNGCAFADAILVFDRQLARELPYLCVRAGHMVSKSRLIAAQFLAYLDDGLWLKLANHANTMADDLRAGLEQTDGLRQAWETQGNEVFAVVDTERLARIGEAGALFYEWPPIGVALNPGETIVRLVTNFSTTGAEVSKFIAILKE